MNIYYILYITVSTFIFLVLCPFLFFYALMRGRYIRGINERLGRIPSRIAASLTGSPRIWIHAVSLGEVRVAQAIINELRQMIPSSSMIVSTATTHGRNLAIDLFGKEVKIIYAPLDIMLFVWMSLNTIRPDALVFLEAEIWPAWISEAKRRGIKIAIINGRISPRSFGRYLRFKPLFGHILSKVDAFSMITEDDKRRITAMGASPSRIIVNGNAKFDLLSRQADPFIEDETRRLFNLRNNNDLLIAGSTHTGEEEMVIEAYKRIVGEFPETILFIAPRHIERSREIAAILEKNKLEFQFRSGLKEGAERCKQVIIIDSFGELFNLYSIGTVIFCGGSLVPLGGQNPMEPAIWAKPVLYGPSMEDFLDAKAILEENRAGIEVSGPVMLAEKVLMLLRDRSLLKEYGLRARDSVYKNRKAAERHAKVITNILTGTY